MSVHPLQSALPRLRTVLDEAETDRDRISRRIRRIRDAIRAVELGEDDPLIADLLEAAAGTRAVALAIAPVAAWPTTPPAPPAQPAAPPMPGMGLLTQLGEGLPPGVLSSYPVPAPQVLNLPAVDVGSLGRMTPEMLDALPYGVVTLDGGGRVIGYNDTESRMAGLPREAVIGRNFFTDVAPCTRVREFEGRFRDFAGGRSRLALETFEFVFHFRAGAQRVAIFVSPARTRGQFHVSMIRR